MLDKEKVSQRLVALRGDESRESVASSISISVSALAMYETGQRIPRDEIKLALAKHFGKSVEDIFFAE